VLSGKGVDNMFEKEAYEWTEKNISVGISMYNPSIEMYCGKAFKDGAEFGYNKANEWQYVKAGDLPKDNKEYLVLYYFNYRGKKEIHCGVRDNLCNDFEIHRCYTEQIIAWKEIVLPKECV
jgi:hypothetical protein